MALRADPTSPEAFAVAIEAALRGGAEPEEGQRHAGSFTWRACAESVLHGYSGAASA